MARATAAKIMESLPYLTPVERAAIRAQLEALDNLPIMVLQTIVESQAMGDLELRYSELRSAYAAQKTELKAAEMRYSALLQAIEETYAIWLNKTIRLEPEYLRLHNSMALDRDESVHSVAVVALVALSNIYEEVQSDQLNSTLSGDLPAIEKLKTIPFIGEIAGRRRFSLDMLIKAAGLSNSLPMLCAALDMGLRTFGNAHSPTLKRAHPLLLEKYGAEVVGSKVNTSKEYLERAEERLRSSATQEDFAASKGVADRQVRRYEAFREIIRQEALLTPADVRELISPK